MHQSTETTNVDAEPPAGGSGIANDQRRALLEAFVIGLIVTIAVGAAIVGVWSSTTTTVRENYREHLTELAIAAAQQVDPALHARIRRPDQMDSPEYLRAVAPLRSMREAIPAIRYLYTVVPDGQQVRIVLDSADAGDSDADGVEDRSTIWDISVSRQSAKYHAVGLRGQPGRPVATDQPYTDAWGTFMTGYAPFYDAAGRQEGAVAVDVDASTYVARLDAARTRMLLGLVPAGLMIIGLTLGVYRLRRRGLTATRAVAVAAQHAHAAARRDKLTGLANRTVFMERLQASITRVQEGRQPLFAVLFLDFDHFKLVNDTLGHDAGDDLLRQIAGRLRSALRLSDALGDGCDDNVVARFGGDEFVVLINNLRKDDDAGTVADRLLNSLAPVYNLRGGDVHSSASIGIVIGHGELENAEAVIRNADVAMYEAKHSGRACYVFFNDAMHTRLTRRVSIESGLRKAIGTSELSLAYQPIVELESGRMVSAEALLRWVSPHFGDVAPAEFIPIAEESGLIVPLGDWVLGEACRQLAEWQRERPDDAPATVSVNVSRAELALGNRLLVRVRDVLARSGLAPHCLQFEVTEREVMRDPAATSSLLQELRALGVRLSMDDFGTGTSSLVCLRDYPFDTVKIDQSFVNGLSSSRDVLALIHATLTLVENLGKSSVAEGVENDAQLAILLSLGCRYAQGHFFSRPVPGDQLLHALARNASPATTAAPFASEIAAA